MTSNLVFASHSYIPSMYSLKREEISTEYELEDIAFSNSYPIKCLLHLVDPRIKQSRAFEIFVFDENGPKTQMREINMNDYFSEIKKNDNYTVVHPMHYMEVLIGCCFLLSTRNMNYFIYSNKLNGITKYGEFSIDLNQYYQKSVWKLQDHRFAIGMDIFALLSLNVNQYMMFINSGCPESMKEEFSMYEREFCIFDANDSILYGIRPSLLYTLNTGREFSFPKYESSIYELIRNNPNPDDKTLVSVMHDYTKTNEDDRFNVMYVFAFKA